MSSSNPNTTKEVYDKTSKILAAIEQCGYAHCLSILKSGLGNQPNHATDDDATTPEVQSRNDQF